MPVNESGLRRIFRDEVTYLRTVYKASRGARVTCRMIFLVGGLLIAVHLGIAASRVLTGGEFTTIFSLRREGGVSEFYEYLLSAAVVILMGTVFVRSRIRAFAFVSALFAFILVDGSLLYHERVGLALSSYLDLPGSGSLLPSDLGEMIAWAVAGLVLVPLLVWCLMHMTHVDLGVYLVYGLVMLALAFFAVGVDVIHAMLREAGVEQVMGTVEDGGELLVLCAAAACAVLYQRGDAHHGRSGTAHTTIAHSAG